MHLKEEKLGKLLSAVLQSWRVECLEHKKWLQCTNWFWREIQIGEMDLLNGTSQAAKVEPFRLVSGLCSDRRPIV